MKKLVFIIMPLLFFSCVNTSYQRRTHTQSDFKPIVFAPMSDAELKARNDREMIDQIAEARKTQKGDRRLVVLRYSMTENTIGTPVVEVKLFNDTDKTINAFELDFGCYDNFGRGVRPFGSRYSSHVFRGISQDSIPPRSEYSAEWVLHGRELTTTVKGFRVGKINFVR